MVLYEIAVKRVQVMWESNQQLGLDLRWVTIHHGGRCCKGPFYLLWYEEDVFQEAFPITMHEGEASAGSVHGLKVPQSGRQAVKVGITENPEDALWYPSVPLVTGCYEDVLITYSRNGLSVAWGMSGDAAMEGMARLQKEGKPDSELLFIPPGAMKIRIPFDSEEGDWSLSLCGKKKNGQLWESLGRDTGEMRILAAPAVLLGVDVEESKVIADYNLPVGRYVGQDEFRIWFVLSSEEKIIYRTGEFVPERNGQSYRQCFSVPSEMHWSQDVCSLALFYRMGRFRYENMGESNIIPLEVPDAEVLVKDTGESLLRWSKADHAKAFLITVEGFPDQISGRKEKIFRPEEAAGRTAAVAAVYGSARIRGPYCGRVDLIPEGFYADHAYPGMLRYRRMETGTASFWTAGKLFKSTLSGQVASGPFSVEEEGGGYALHLDYSGDFGYGSLKSWLEGLFRNGLTPFGYYSLRNMVARLSPLAGAEMLPYYCGAVKNGLSVDLLPGFLLYIENEYYIRQTADGMEKNNGFVRGAATEYVVSLEGRGQDAVLEMNSLLSHVVGSWTDGAWRRYPLQASGLMDFFLAPLRSAYYRLCYPKSFPDGEQPGSMYAGNNICLMALLPCEATPDNVDDTDLPGIMLRGRTAVAVNLEVFVNHMPVTVPVGTTLAGLLSRYAADPSKIRFFRRTGWADGICLPVFLGEAAGDQGFMEAVVLLAGDRIEV